MPKTIGGDDLPVQYVDGWMAHKHNVDRKRNPYDVRVQFASYELWTEGFMSRKSAARLDGDLSLDDFVPRATL